MRFIMVFIRAQFALLMLANYFLNLLFVGALPVSGRVFYVTKSPQTKLGAILDDSVESMVWSKYAWSITCKFFK